MGIGANGLRSLVRLAALAAAAAGIGGACSSGSGSATSASAGAGAAPSGCTADTVKTVCGADATCRKYGCTAGMCTPTDAAKGTACTEGGGKKCDGQGKCVACTGNADCDSGHCVDGACQPCTDNANCDPDKYCDTAAKKCVADKKVGDACTDAGQCPKDQCADGVCCDAPCNGSCEACSKMGACQKVINATDENSCGAMTASGSCVMPPCQCDATSICRGKNGASCKLAADCLSGHCTDGVCCASACSGACIACNVPNNLGACSPVVGKDDPDSCSKDVNNSNGGCGGLPCSCDAGGNCHGGPGAACQANNQCISANCAMFKCQ